jgi:hypothetical protein
MGVDMKIRIKHLKLLCVALVCSCASSHAEVSREQAVKMAEAYIGKNIPYALPRHATAFAHEGKKYWIVEYVLPEGAAGGAPTVIIDKMSGQVVDVAVEQ